MEYAVAIRGELENIEREMKLIERLIKKEGKDHLDDIEIRAAALSLSTIYNGMEKVIEFGLKKRETAIPASGNWHASLLKLAEKNGLIDKETHSELLGFMGFRHFIRHAYSFQIDPAAITEILKKCPKLVASFCRQIESAIMAP